MALLLTLLLLNILNFVLAMIVIGYVSSSKKIAPIRWMLVLAVSFCVISFCTLGVYISRDFESQIFFSKMRFLTLGLLSPSWFLFILSIYGRWKWIRNKWVTFFIFLPGCITTLLAVVPAGNKFITHSFAPTVVNGFNVLRYSTGAWFPVHYMSAMLFVLLSVVFGIYFFIREAGGRRRQIVLLLVSSTLAAVVDIYCVLTNSPLRWLLLSSGTFIFSQLGIVIAAWKLRLLDIVPLAMSQVFNEFPDPVFVVDKENIIRSANKAAIYFFNLENILGEKFNTVLPQVLLVNGEVALSNHFQEQHFFNLSVEKIMANAEDLSGHIIFFRQITVQKVIEKSLNENLEFKARLLSMIAHDFSGFLQTQTYLSSNLEKNVDASLKRQAGTLAESTFASKDFMTNILLWVRTQENQFKPIIRPFEMNILLKEMISNLESVWKIHDLNIVLKSQMDPLIVEGDSVMIESVVRNLLTNAIRASTRGQSILINVQNNAQDVVITVKDDGLGMSEKQLGTLQQNLQEPFSEPEKRPNGFGLGLAIARRFVVLHNGKLNFYSKEGQGTLVTLTLPL